MGPFVAALRRAGSPRTGLAAAARAASAASSSAASSSAASSSAPLSAPPLAALARSWRHPTRDPATTPWALGRATRAMGARPSKRDIETAERVPTCESGAGKLVAALTDEQRETMLQALLGHRAAAEGGDVLVAVDGETQTMTRAEMRALFDHADLDGDQTLTRREFEHMLLRLEKARSAFRDGDDGASPKDSSVSPDASGTLSSGVLWSIFAAQAIPFVGFGFMDNAIMIIAGEYIEMSIGATFALSTMAAAGLGNLLSDIAGVGFSSKIELACERMGITAPELSRAQQGLFAARWAKIMGAVLGISAGCLLGMFPLLFFDADHDHNLRPDAPENPEDTPKGTTDATRESRSTQT